MILASDRVELPHTLDLARAARDRARALVPSPALLATLQAHTLTQADVSGPLGALSTSRGRTFVNATWAADWSAYDADDDRVDHVRLAFVVGLFPSGFTLYTVADTDGARVPVGYAGWYPVTANTLTLLTNHPEEVSHRGQIPPVSAVDPAGALYVFNYSVVAPLRRTIVSRTLLTELSATLDAQPCRRRCAVTVSDDGARVARRLGMTHRADLVVGASMEQVYATPT